MTLTLATTKYRNVFICARCFTNPSKSLASNIDIEAASGQSYVVTELEIHINFNTWLISMYVVTRLCTRNYRYHIIDIIHKIRNELSMVTSNLSRPKPLKPLKIWL